MGCKKGQENGPWGTKVTFKVYLWHFGGSGCVVSQGMSVPIFSSVSVMMNINVELGSHIFRT